MHSPKIKICDVRTMESLRICRENEVDFIGVHLIDPPITQEKVDLFREITENASPIKTVLLTKTVPFDDLVSLLRQVPFDYVQLHRPCSVTEVIQLRNLLNTMEKKVGIIVVYEAANCNYDAVLEMSHYVDYILFDSQYRGGTGYRISQTDLVALSNSCQGVPFFVAGGLNSDNVVNVIRTAHPFGVDVQTGVECAKHIKDSNKVRSFVKNVRSID